MYYIIQENVFREIHYDRIIQAIERLGLPYEIIKVGQRNGLHFETQRKDVFCFGSMKLARLAQKYQWKPGSLMNENHDYLVYSQYWENEMLNADSVIQTLDSDVDFSTGNKFIRPTKDSKIFTGKVFKEVDWHTMQERALQSPLAENALIQIATPKKIYQEVRCWVVKQKVITASTYRIGYYVNYIEYTDEDGLAFANKMANLFQVADAFVLDIGYTDSGWKIVEVNCINSAGFYACDLQKLLMSLEECFFDECEN